MDSGWSTEASLNPVHFVWNIAHAMLFGVSASEEEKNFSSQYYKFKNKKMMKKKVLKKRMTPAKYQRLARGEVLGT